MFHDRRRLRRWAAQLLLAWLFGLAMGVVNACVISEPTHDRSPSEQRAQHASSPHDDQAGRDAAHENCLDFCGKSSIGVPQLKVTDDSSTAATFAVIASGYPVIAMAGERTRVAFPVAPTDRHGSPPLRIAYGRLAL